MSYQPYTTLLSMCSICKKRHCNLLTTLEGQYEEAHQGVTQAREGGGGGDGDGGGGGGGGGGDGDGYGYEHTRHPV